jgi:hypothetical protein
MDYDRKEGRRKKLAVTWRLLATQMIDLGYDESDVFETMAGVALSLGAAGQASRPAEEEDGQVEKPEPQLPRASWDFPSFSGRTAEH